MAANIKDNKKPRLKNLDDLFDLNNGVNPLEQNVAFMQSQPDYNRTVVNVELDKLTPFSGHPFRLYYGERLEDLVASIKANGVLVPVIVRKVDAILEILAGHNRVNAAKLAGLEVTPAIILNNISDEDAMAYVIETNLIQRSFADMTHSEKAAVIALHHSKMFSQGKRNDILDQLKMLENPHEYRENRTCAQNANRLKTIDKVGQEYGLSKDTVARYIRVNKLIDGLKTMLDDGKIPFISAVMLSYIKESEQILIIDCMKRNSLFVDLKKAVTLRQYSSKGKLNAESVYQILSGVATPKPNRTPTVKINKAVYAKYFKPGLPAKEVQGIVEKALEMYFKHK